MLASDGSLVLDHEINLVLQDNDLVSELHDIDSDQVLTSLWLWIGLITCYEKEGSVHDSCTCKHRCHEGIVTWAIDEGDVSLQDELCAAELTWDCIRLGRVE